MAHPSLDQSASVGLTAYLFCGAGIVPPLHCTGCAARKRFFLPRSGLALRHGVTALNTPGLIDAGYRGEVKVLLINHDRVAAAIARGDRIAQLVIQRVEPAELIEVDELPPSDRGAGGFGSTGR